MSDWTIKAALDIKSRLRQEWLETVLGETDVAD
jgi:hypothetical protein